MDTSTDLFLPEYPDKPSSLPRLRCADLSVEESAAGPRRRSPPSARLLLIGSWGRLRSTMSGLPPPTPRRRPVSRSCGSLRGVALIVHGVRGLGGVGDCRQLTGYESGRLSGPQKFDARQGDSLPPRSQPRGVCRPGFMTSAGFGPTTEGSSLKSPASGSNCRITPSAAGRDLYRGAIRGWLPKRCPSARTRSSSGGWLPRRWLAGTRSVHAERPAS